MGGDLFALVHRDGTTTALNASGRAGSGADPDGLRRDGHTEMPLHHDIRTVTVPGCVDGWIALHDRFGTMPLADLLAPAIRLAQSGFPASPLLAGSLRRLDDRGAEQLASLAAGSNVGVRVVRPGVAAASAAIAEGGRAAFYEGEFGAGLIGLGNGLYTRDDLARSQADWVEPLTTNVFGLSLHTIPPNSQGYLALAALWLAEKVGLPDDPDDPEWAHVLIECATAAAYDRPTVLHDRADGHALLDAIDSRADMVDRHKSSQRHGPGDRGDTTYLCTVDGDGMGVSLIQSNAAGPRFLDRRAEHRHQPPQPRARLRARGRTPGRVRSWPAPAAHAGAGAGVARDGDLVSGLRTMGGDAQPQILLQIAGAPSSATVKARIGRSAPHAGR